MDTNSIITIIIILALTYVVIKFIVSPLIKIVTGIVILLLVVYVLQNYFGFSFNQYLGPFSKYINIDKTLDSFGWVIGPIASYIDTAVSFIKKFISSNNL